MNSNQNIIVDNLKKIEISSDSDFSNINIISNNKNYLKPSSKKNLLIEKNFVSDSSSKNMTIKNDKKKISPRRKSIQNNSILLEKLQKEINDLSYQNNILNKKLLKILFYL